MQINIKNIIRLFYLNIILDIVFRKNLTEILYLFVLLCVLLNIMIVNYRILKDQRLAMNQDKVPCRRKSNS